MSDEFVNRIKNAAKKKDRRKASTNFKDIDASASWMQQNIKDLKHDVSFINSPLKEDKQYVTSIKGKGKKMSDLRISSTKPEPPKYNKSFGKKINHPKPAVPKPPPEPTQYVTGIKGKGKKTSDLSITKDKPASPVFRKNIATRPSTQQGSKEADLDFIMKQANPNVKNPKAPDMKVTVPSKVAKDKTKKLKGIIKTKPSIRRASKDKVRIGGMYMYAYDAKTKEQMKYYDEFPLILFVEPAKGGHFGINLHYVPPPVRELIINELLAMSTKANTDTGYMQLSWSLLKRLSEDTKWRNCFKRYLSSHIRSSFYEVDPESWEYAINLPHAAFVSHTRIKGSRVKVSNTTVWNDSMR